MSKIVKTWLIFILIFAGIVALFVGWSASVYSVTIASIIAAVLWVGAIVMAFAVGRNKSMKPHSKIVTDEGCRKATQRR